MVNLNINIFSYLYLFVVFAAAHEPPSQRVQFILGMTDEDGTDILQTHEVFCEMDELRYGGDDNDIIWKEAAR